MKIPFACKVMSITILATLVVASSGCFSRTSTTLIYETEITFVDAIKASNTVGSIVMQGEADREDAVLIRTEKRVTAYSLFGMLDPDDYLDLLETTETLEEGVATLSTAAISPVTPWWGFSVSPEVKRFIYSPVVMEATLAMDVGSLQVNTINGPITANVDTGDITIQTDALLGDNYFGVDVGTIMVSLPATAEFRYDLSVDVGGIDSGGFDIAVTHPDVTSSYADGCVQGNCNASAYVEASVDVGNITFSKR